MESKLVFATTLVLIFCAKSSLAGPHGDHPWCYNTPACDSKTWSGMCHTGKVQSPVDFNTENISENRTQVRLRFNQAYFDVQNRFYAKNNGHTLQVQLEQDLSSKLVMDGDGLKGNYVFSQFHFHWGSTDDKGSEHTVGGKSYPLELHLVHYNDMFKGLGDAVGSKNHRALAVFGIFFKISPNDNWALKPIIEAIAGSQNVQEEASLIHRPLNISSFFPDELDLFRYYGSLTTPSCFEIVHWNVFKKPVPISKAQLQAFRSIKDSHGDNLVDNFRPTLPLAGRRVTEYEVVELDLKPSKTAEDARKPMPDADYEEVMNVLDPKTTSSHGKKSSAAAPRTNFLLLGLLSGVVLFFPKLK
ncbi:carbonic anhydrase 2 isoform X2 [Folsomia candida]|uniref:Carbonic anhydrase n=2 Tax=Folsomia candida TaxID=158441 RepID=A0A226EX10_FOLCA|nr:carbonic anhydrase 2 isoform X2 [Folsomia candida]OXA61604.1 Carbonic anhydrase 2 [Folsomia candida]